MGPQKRPLGPSVARFSAVAPAHGPAREAAARWRAGSNRKRGIGKAVAAKTSNFTELIVFPR